MLEARSEEPVLRRRRGVRLLLHARHVLGAFIAIFLIGNAPVGAAPGDITTIAGGTGPTEPLALAVQPTGLAFIDGALFVTDFYSNTLYRFDLAANTVTAVAGDGSNANARPGVTAGPPGTVFFTDPTLKRLDLSTSTVTVVHDVKGGDLAYDAARNVIYLSQEDSHRVVQVDLASGVVTVVAGRGKQGFDGDGGPAALAALRYPRGVALGEDGHLWIADWGNRRVRVVDLASQTITTAAGNGEEGPSGDGGLATNARLAAVTDVVLDVAGNAFLADVRVRRIDAVTKKISGVAGTGHPEVSGDGGPALAAQLYYPSSIALAPNGDVYIGSSFRVRRVTVSDGIIDTVLGNGTVGFSGDGGPALQAQLADPVGVAVDAADNVYIVGAFDCQVRRVDAVTGTITTLAGVGDTNFAGCGFSGDGGPANKAELDFPEGIAVDSRGNVFIADTDNHRIRRVDAATREITTVAGIGVAGYGGDDGLAKLARLNEPSGLAIDSRDNLYIADTENHAIRVVDAVTHKISTVAGNGGDDFDGDGGPAIDASLDTPEGVAIDLDGDLLIADTDNERIRRVDLETGIITTIVGGGRSKDDHVPAGDAKLLEPVGVAVNRHGDIFISDMFGEHIRRVDGRSFRIDTIAGTGQYGYAGDGGPALLAALHYPEGIAVDSHGNVLVADSENRRVRRIEAPPRAELQEDCGDCVDNDGDGLVDRDDDACLPVADGSGNGLTTGNAKALVACAAAIQKAGLKLAAVTERALRTCANTVFACLQNADERAKCLAKARTKCEKATAAMGSAPDGPQVAFLATMTKACGAAKPGAPPAVTASEMLDPAGLGYEAEQQSCTKLGVASLDSPQQIGACVVAAERCRVTQIVAADMPRLRELLDTGGVPVSSLPCLDGATAARSDSTKSAPVGKRLTKCQSAIAAAGSKFTQAVGKAYTRCSLALVRCAQVSPNDQACHTKARAQCGKTIATLFDTAGGEPAKLLAKLTKTCGTASSVSADDLRAGSGLGFAGMDATCKSLGVSSVASIGDIGACVLDHHACRTDQLLTIMMPRAHELIRGEGLRLP